MKILEQLAKILKGCQKISHSVRIERQSEVMYGSGPNLCKPNGYKTVTITIDFFDPKEHTAFIEEQLRRDPSLLAFKITKAEVDL